MTPTYIKFKKWRKNKKNNNITVFLKTLLIVQALGDNSWNCTVEINNQSHVVSHTEFICIILIKINPLHEMYGTYTVCMSISRKF